jgi:hypothetical protein
MGTITVDKPGEYRFYCGSNDGSKLSVNNKLIIVNDGTHGYKEKTGTINLKKGEHTIMVEYFQQGGGKSLKVFWEGSGFKKREI